MPHGSRNILVPVTISSISSLTMNRGPLILTIEEAEYLLDQLPPPVPDADDLAKKLRMRLLEFLQEVRKGAEGTKK
ncbi:hypothetical protein V1517DRAFT_321385 [Lipomyces orientalis]|uniref:Uncharacterized protein n=1 Tax=Lipomyces orientalis TaxID=1233043 RepID=A0ACC3TQZ4_9ASCO